MTQERSEVAVLVPCYNEAVTIHAVVTQFKAAFPSAVVYVYDNNSADDTAAIAEKAGAVVRPAQLQGKGNVVRRMFAEIDAEVYVLVDGDGTYDASAAPAMVEKLRRERLDMVVGCRKEEQTAAYPAGHRFGNWLFTYTISRVFGQSFTDILSGYRVFSRRFVRSFPAHSTGFEIETEITVHSLQMRLASGEIETHYAARPDGSESKLHTFRDGYRIARLILSLVLSERPLLLFGSAAFVAFLIGISLVIPVCVTYLETGLVPQFPSLIVGCSALLFSMLCLCFGYVFDRVALARREIKHLFYLRG